MAGLNRPFRSLPVATTGFGRSSKIGEDCDPGLAFIRSEPIPSQWRDNCCIQDLAKHLAETNTIDPRESLHRLETFQHVRTALDGQSQGHSRHPNFAKRVTSGIASFLHSFRPDVGVDSEASEEKKQLLSELSQRTGGRCLIHLPTFQSALRIKGEEFAGRLFHALDTSSVGTITDEQLVDSLVALKRGSLEDKVAFIWSFVARDSDSISWTELHELLKASCSEGDLRVDDEVIQDLTAAFFVEARKTKADKLSLEEFTSVLRSRSEIRQSLEFGGLNAGHMRETNNLKQDVAPLPCFERISCRVLAFFRIENVPLSMWITIILCAQLAGFIVGFLQNDHGREFGVFGWSYPTAKGAARSIQVICIIFPFTMARTLLTCLRSTPLHRVLPLDEHINVHRQLGYQFFVWSLVHTIAHFINGARVADPSRHHGPNALAYMTQAQFYQQEVSITGVLLMGFICVGYFFAVQWPFKTWVASSLRLGCVLNRFEAFYFTHIIMAVSVLILLIIHPFPGPARHPEPHHSTTWAYLAGGTIIYILERIARVARQFFWSTNIIGVKLHKGNVTELRLAKPKARSGALDVFACKAGQYCFLNIPELARFEWHPFSLTSGPNDDFISFHIRCAGSWTTALYKRCEATLSSNGPSKLQEQSALNLSSSVLTRDLPVHLDGPFGAPAQDHSRFDCILLVGAGIGVTPFASVLRQTMDEYRRSLCECCKTVNEKLFRPRKLYFVWMTREQTSPQFIKDTLQDIMLSDTGAFLDISIYLTKVLPQNDLRVTITRVAQMLQHEQHGYDGLSGSHLPVPCYFGRPSWPAIFDNINQVHMGQRVGVFVCGPPALSMQIKGVCKSYNERCKRSRSEDLLQTENCKFVFHKENF